MSGGSTVRSDEVAKFSAIAEEWWDEGGKFKPLHQMNPIRISYIREKAISHFGLADNLTPFSGLKILDIGCGGGLLSEPMARLGAEVTGIDASEKNIKIASLHSEKSGVKVNYRNITSEELAATGEKFDIILNMEVIEHVADVPLFLKSCAELLKPNGLMFVATMNRTAKAFAFAIVGAEYVLRLLPKGTHDWKKFLKPSEISQITEKLGLKLEHMTGVSYNPLTQKFSFTKDVSVNYVMCFKS